MKTLSITCVSCSVVLLIFGAGAFAQSTLSGTVTDAETGEGLGGANVVIQGTTSGTATNLDGSFKLEADLAFPWKVVVSYIGYSSQTVTVHSANNSLSISLRPLALFGELLVVSASRKSEKVTESPASVSVVTSRRIATQATEGDALNLIKNTQGVRLVNNGIAKINVTLRGQALVNETLTLVLKDYRPLFNAHTTIIDNERMGVNPLDIEQIEVIHGPSGALWGPGVNAGVVHFLTKSPLAHPGTAVSFNRSLEGQGVARIDFRHAASTDKFGYKILYSHRSGDDFVYDLQNQDDIRAAKSLLNAAGPPSLRDGIIQGVTGGPDIPMPTEIDANGNLTYNLIPDFHSNTVEAVVTYAPSDELSFTIAPQYGESLINFRNAGGHTRDWGNIFNLQGRVNYKGLFASMNYFKAFDWNGKNGGTSLGNRSTALITTETTNRGDIDIYDFVSQIPFTAGKTLDFLAGFDAKILRFVGSPPDVPQLRSRHGRFENDDNYDVLGAYLQASYTISDNLKANAVGRFDNFSIYGSSFSPRLGLVYNPGGNKDNAIRIGLSRAFRAPSPIITNFDVVLAAQNVLGARDDITWNKTYIKYGALGLDRTDESPSLASVLKSILPRLDAADQAALTGVTLNGELTPTFSDPHTREPIAKISDQFIRKAKLESTTGIDIGFSGSAMSNKVSYSLDAFYQVQQNMLVNFTLVGPKVDFKSLDTELRTALANAGVDAALADRVVKAASAAYSAGFHAMSDQHQEDTAVALVNPFPSSGFRSFDGKAEYLGLEGSIQYAMNQGFIPYANVSWLSDVVFDPQELGEHVGSLNTYYLNSSPFRIRFGVNKAATGNKGFYGSIAARYDAEFEAQDGVWNGTVPSYFLVDASVGYQFSSGLKVGFNSTNVTDELYRSLPNMPAQRRLVFANLSYALDYNLLRK